MRDMNGFVETRRQLLVLKSNNKQHWVAYAVSNYVAGNYDRYCDEMRDALRAALTTPLPNYGALVFVGNTAELAKWWMRF